MVKLIKMKNVNIFLHKLFLKTEYILILYTYSRIEMYVRNRIIIINLIKLKLLDYHVIISISWFGYYLFTVTFFAIANFVLF